ncbi:MAG: LytTR family transcriptional regulator DNA-binding domain-containing protein [Parasporobacterium sp.]|nr:LytTR family transcriptional regulator DNA-binding domain-containing protein [Parasporobacterium sp.]
MLIRREIHPGYRELEIHVCKNKADDEVSSIMDTLHGLFDETLEAVDMKGNERKLPIFSIYAFFAEGQRVYALDENTRYAVSRKLYELEQAYEKQGFVRISKSELVNVRKIGSLDLSLTGTVKVIMKNGYETYSSRRNVSKIREIFRRDKAGAVNGTMADRKENINLPMEGKE